MSETSAGFPADRLGTWLENAARRRPPPMPASLLADLRNILAEHKLMTEHLVECPSMAAAEQQPADVVTAEQQQDGAAEDVTAFLDAWEADRGFGNAIRGGNGDIPYLFATDLRAVLAERTALAARVAELESERASLAVLLLAEPDEREADTRAVLAVLKLGEVLYLGQRPTDWADARRQLNARFADRIEALDAGTAGGAE